MWEIDPREKDARVLRLKIGKILEELEHGLHESGQDGEGIDFLGVRPFQFGDQPSRVDWLLSGRSDEDIDLVVRMFAPERKIAVVVVADLAPSMYVPKAKALYAQGVVELFARSAFCLGGPVCIVGHAERELLSSGWLTDTDALMSFLRLSDNPRLRRSYVERYRSIEAFFAEWRLRNALIVFVSDLRVVDALPMNFLGSINPEKDNVRVAYVMLDEWWGFKPSRHLFPVRHPETESTTFLDMREGGDIHRQVILKEDRLKELRTRGRRYGMHVFTLPLAHEHPLREFDKAWHKHAYLSE
ncbi:MAG: DUF58 domain-containing protein [Patescibacteria group bacterium]